MKKNDFCALKITGLTSEGSGVGRTDEGMAVFVPLTAVGDVISCKIVKVNKTYAFGIIDNILEPSKTRCENDCGVYQKCGGCLFRHISYEAELAAKEQSVKDAFSRLGGLDVPFEPILGCEETQRYRNKAQYPLTYDENGKAVCGFFAPRSHRVVPCGDCLLQPKLFKDITDDICGYIDEKKLPLYDEKSGKGLIRHIYLRRGFHSGEVMVCLIVTKADTAAFKPLSDKLCGKYPEIKSIILNINSKATNVITGESCITLAGKDNIEDTMCGRKIAISPLSFYQVNTAQAERLYDVAKEYAQLGGEDTLLDLFCGAGTVGLSMSDGIKRLIGGEIIPQAVENAKKNAAANGVENSEFICGDAGEIAASLAAKGIRPDVIVTDPPRKGCDEQTLSSIVKMSPERIVMISCNPATAARDCAYLCEHGYKAETARAVDMFPRTKHVETVCLLSKLKSDQHIEVELKTDELDLTSAESKATYDEIKTYVKEHRA
ncbi:MAG: 23S rRNA (uracil(1939)-C(5))-methyltransferase RlmD [Oscillospiraceae bacterium]